MRRLAATRQSLRFLRGNMRVFCITGAIGMFGRQMAFPYAALLILELGGRPEDVGLVNSLAPLAGLIFFPIAGYLSDHSSRVRLIVVSGVIATLCSSLYVVAPVWQFIAFAAVLGSITVLQFPPSSAMIADSLAPEDRGRGIAVMSTLSGLPAFVAPLLAGLLLDRVGYLSGMRMLYAVLTIGTLASTTINKRWLVDGTIRDPRPKATLRDMAKVVVDTYSGVPELVRSMPKALRTQACVVALCFMANAFAGPFWVVYALDQIGLDSGQWGLILLVESIVRTTAYLGTGILVDKVGRRRCLLCALGMCIVTAPLFVIASGFWAVLALRIVAALATATFVPASSAIMADLMPREQRGRIMAAIGRGSTMLLSTSGGTGGPGLGYLLIIPIMLTSYAAGHLYSLGPKLPWIALGVLLLTALLLTALFVRDPEQAEA